MNNTLSPYHAEQARTQLAGREGEHPPVNLWDMLHDLGSKLIFEHGFSPANLQGCSNHVNRTTEPLVRFLVWLQHTPEAVAVLRELDGWQESIGGPAEVELNRSERLPTLAEPDWPRKKRNSVA